MTLQRLRLAILLFSCLSIGCPRVIKPDLETNEKSREVVVEKEDIAEPGSVEISASDVSFESQGVTFHGSIHRPQTAEISGAVLILHDWGPWDKNGTARESFGLRLPVEVQIYRGIAETLAENGFLTMSYDKRTCVSGASLWCTYGPEFVEKEKLNLASAFAADAKAALETLTDQPGVTSNRIFVVAHGHGAEVALELAKDPRVSGVTLLVPQADAPDQIAQFQTQQSVTWIDRELGTGSDDRMKDLLKQKKKALKKVLTAQKKTFTAMRNGNTAEVAFGLPGTAWLNFFKSHSTFLANLEKVTVPTMIVTGGSVSSYPNGEQTFGEIASNSESVQHIHVPGLCQLLVKPASDSPTVIADEVIEAILSIATTTAN